MGATVELVCGPTRIKTSHPNIHRTDVESAQEMYNAATNLFPNADAAILCAAVADFTVARTADSKIKREKDGLTLQLIPTQDIAAALGAMKREHQKLIGFALETNNERDNARKKLLRKNLDFIVLNSLNDAGAGFSYDTNKITILSRQEEEEYPLKPKTEVAQDIINRLCKEFNG